MLDIDVTKALVAFKAGNDMLWSRHLPFAISQAINKTGTLAIQAEQDNEEKVLDRPRPFTKGAIRMIRANKAKFQATVFMMDITARYLKPYEFGGSNVLNSKALLKPVGAMKDLDQYGNLPRRFLAQMKNRKDVFIGTVNTKLGPVEGLWQRSTEGAKVSVLRTRKDGTVRVGKTAKNINNTGRLKLLVKFTDAHPVEQNLDWFGVAEKTVNGAFPGEMSTTFQQALATAR